MTTNLRTNRRWLGFELSVLRRLKFSSVAIPFAGQPDLGWYLKFWGKQILNNDVCQWAWWMSRALVENQGETLNEEDVSLTLSEAYVPRRRLNNPALGPMLNEIDAVWFDNVWLNIQQIENEHRRALAYSTVFGVGDYVFSFTPETITLRRPLSEVFIALWRNSRHIVNNEKLNYSVNHDAHEFIRGARAAYEMIVTAFAEGDRRTLEIADSLSQQMLRVIGVDLPRYALRISGLVSLDKRIHFARRFVPELVAADPALAARDAEHHGNAGTQDIGVN